MQGHQAEILGLDLQQRLWQLVDLVAHVVLQMQRVLLVALPLLQVILVVQPIFMVVLAELAAHLVLLAVVVVVALVLLQTEQLVC